MIAKARQFGITFLLVLLAAATVLQPVGPARAGGCSESSPPTNYWRQIEFRVTDLAQRPVACVGLELDVKWGDLAPRRWFVTNDDGKVVISVKPVVENKDVDKHIRDRFLGYRLWLEYRLVKEGYIPHQACINDHQEYACFADPLYQGLNKIPDDKPLVVPVTLHAYGDYLSAPPKKEPPSKDEAPVCTDISEGMKALIERLVKATPYQYSPLPGSIACLPGNGLKIGLTFDLLFDPSEMGLKAAAKVMLKGPVRRVLNLIRQSFEPDLFTYYRIDIQTAFQYKKSPHDIPEYRTMQYNIPSHAVNKVIESAPGPVPCRDIEITAGKIPILLTP